MPTSSNHDRLWHTQGSGILQPGAGLLIVILWASCGTGQAGRSQPDPSVAADPTREATTERIRAHTKLWILVQELRDQHSILPERDHEDPIPLPVWFRTLLRRELQGLPRSGRPQYPLASMELLDWLVQHQTYTEKDLRLRLDSLRRSVAEVSQQNERWARYPAEWEVSVPPDTALERLRDQLELEFKRLPERDLEDQTPLPVWFRVYMRKVHPELPTMGAYQYPRTAVRILQRLLANPNASDLKP